MSACSRMLGTGDDVSGVGFNVLSRASASRFTLRVSSIWRLVSLDWDTYGAGTGLAVPSVLGVGTGFWDCAATGSAASSVMHRNNETARQTFDGWFIILLRWVRL